MKKIILLLMFIFISSSFIYSDESNDKLIQGVWKYVFDNTINSSFPSSNDAFITASIYQFAFKFDENYNFYEGNVNTDTNEFIQQEKYYSNAAWILNDNILTINYKLINENKYCTETYDIVFIDNNSRAICTLKSTNNSSISQFIGKIKYYCVKLY